MKPKQKKTLRRKKNVSFEGSIERIEIGRKFILIEGWMVDRRTLLLPKNMVIAIEKREVKTAIKRMPRADVVNQGKSIGDCGFRCTFRKPSYVFKYPSITIGTPQFPIILVPDQSTQVGPGVIRGCIDNYDDTTINGWLDLSNVDEPETVTAQLFLGDLPAVEIVTTVERDDIVTEAISLDSKVGFSTSINEVLATTVHKLDQTAPFHDNSLVLSLRTNNQILSTITLTPKITGRIESFNQGILRGWALRRIPMGLTVEFQLNIEGVYYGTFPAKDIRPDLSKVASRYEGGGFSIPIPIPVTNDSDITATLSGLPCHTAFRGSPFKIAAPKKMGLPNSIAPLQLLNDKANHDTTIIIPIYNAIKEAQQCLKSVQKYTNRPARLIIIDDCSTDRKISKLLDHFGQLLSTTIIRNEINLGFTRTVNKALTRAGKTDVVLLNSDTVVGPRWLEGLKLAAYSGRWVATATAISDNAGAFSVPQLGENNNHPAWLNHEQYARMVAHSGLGLLPQVPTGNGFCMYIRRDCIDAIGTLDEVAFPRGYGEENDFCMRAIRAGWAHVVADRTLVYHKRSASFGEEKKELYKAGRDIIQSRFPEYSQMTQVFHTAPEFLAMRYQIRRLYVSPKVETTGKPRILFVISTQTGGTPQTNRDLMQGIRDEYETWLLKCDSKSLELSLISNDSSKLISSIQLNQPIHIYTHRSEEYDHILADWLIRFSIELVHLRHIAWHGLGLFKVCNRLSIPTLFSFHDFYTICPTVKLLDNNLQYCGGICSSTEGHCKTDLWPFDQLPELKNKWVIQWKTMMEYSLKKCDAFVTTSDSARKILIDNFPFLEHSNFNVIPHGRSFRTMRRIGKPPSPFGPVKILVPGNIDDAKGASIISALHEADQFAVFEFHILGDSTPELRGNRIVKHGTYKREDFERRVETINPHFGAVFSIWPETYCHTLTELWSIGLPVLAFDFGAVAERVRKTGAGWILPHNDIAVLLSKINKIVFSKPEYQKKLEQVYHWQSNEGLVNNITRMSLEYRKLYKKLIVSRRAFLNESQIQTLSSLKPRVAVITQGNVLINEAPGSVHVRVWEWIHNGQHREIEYVRYSLADSEVPLTHLAFAAIMVQRNSVKPVHLDYLIQLSQQANIPIIMELDDDLLNVPEDKDPSGSYLAMRDTLKLLMDHAKLLIVSTQYLKKTYSKYNQNIVVIENRLSARLWFSPLTEQLTINGNLVKKSKEEIRIIYMGSNTHDEDLLLIKPAIEQLKNTHPEVRFFVIGGEIETSRWYERIDIPEKETNYPKFVSWFRSIAKTMDFAIGPLVDNEFNRAKSGLKFLEYAGAGLSGLFSDVEAYQHLVKSSGLGHLVTNGEEEWYHALVKAINQKEEMKSVGKQVQRWVCSHYIVESSTDLLDSTVMSAIRNKGENSASSSKNHITKFCTTE